MAAIRKPAVLARFDYKVTTTLLFDTGVVNFLPYLLNETDPGSFVKDDDANCFEHDKGYRTTRYLHAFVPFSAEFSLRDASETCHLLFATILVEYLH